MKTLRTLLQRLNPRHQARDDLSLINRNRCQCLCNHGDGVATAREIRNLIREDAERLYGRRAPLLGDVVRGHDSPSVDRTSSVEREGA